MIMLSYSAMWHVVKGPRTVPSSANIGMERDFSPNSVPGKTHLQHPKLALDMTAALHLPPPLNPPQPNSSQETLVTSRHTESLILKNTLVTNRHIASF